MKTPKKQNRYYFYSIYKNCLNFNKTTCAGLEFFVLCLLLVISATTAKGQYCRGSSLLYIVRDAKGRIINPAKLDAPAFIEENVRAISYAEAEKQREGYWAEGEAVKEARKQRFAALDKETGSLFALHESSGGACAFTKPMTYRLSSGGKTMNLIFRFNKPKFADQVYLVDSLPFQQGTYEIDMDDKAANVAAANWRKTSDTAEEPGKIAAYHIRGRVIDAITKKPIVNAVVRFRTAPPFYGIHSGVRKERSETITDAKGRFAFERLRGDLLDQSSIAAVFIEHPDYMVNKYAEVFQQTNEQWRQAIAGKPVVSFKSPEDLTVELVPLVTVSGRMVDAATGNSFPASEDFAKNFRLTAEYGEGGYLGGNLDIPRGRIEVRPSPDGSFRFKTAPGKNKFSVSGKINGRAYYLVGYSQQILIDEAGLKDLVLKIQLDPKSAAGLSAALFLSPPTKKSRLYLEPKKPKFRLQPKGQRGSGEQL